MLNQIVEKGSVQNRRRVEFLSGDGSADNSEDSGTDHGADAKRGEGERPECLGKPPVGVFRVGNQLVDGLGGKELGGSQRLLPVCVWPAMPAQM